MTLNDQELRDRFAELRGEDTAQAPDFASLLRRTARTRRPWRVRRLAIATASIAVLVAAVALSRFYSRRPAPNVSITEWQSPTDFLLQTPGHELLEGIPKIGQWPDEPAPSVPTATPAGRKKS